MGAVPDLAFTQDEGRLRAHGDGQDFKFIGTIDLGGPMRRGVFPAEIDQSPSPRRRAIEPGHHAGALLDLRGHCRRVEALEFAVSLLRPGDLLLVAGKGHEDYQILASGRIHFDDREELRKALPRGALQ